MDQATLNVHQLISSLTEEAAETLVNLRETAQGYVVDPSRGDLPALANRVQAIVEREVTNAGSVSDTALNGCITFHLKHEGDAPSRQLRAFTLFRVLDWCSTSSPDNDTSVWAYHDLLRRSLASMGRVAIFDQSGVMPVQRYIDHLCQSHLHTPAEMRFHRMTLLLLAEALPVDVVPREAWLEREIVSLFDSRRYGGAVPSVWGGVARAVTTHPWVADLVIDLSHPINRVIEYGTPQRIIEAVTAHPDCVYRGDSDYLTPLHRLIARIGDEGIDDWKELLQTLRDNGADINARSRKGKTPFEVAVDCGNRALIVWLIQKYGLVNLYGTLFSALTVAAKKDPPNVEVVKALVEQGLPLDLRNELSQTPYAALKMQYGETPSDKQRAVLGLLRPPDGATPRPIDKPPLEAFFVAYADDPLGVTEAMLDAIDLNALQVGEQLTPLMLAALNGDLLMIRRLVEKGARPEKCRADGITPLHLAAIGKGALEVLIFLQKVVGRQVKTIYGMTPWQFVDIIQEQRPRSAKVIGDESSPLSPLHQITQRGDLAQLMVLASRPITINCRSVRGTPLDVATDVCVIPAVNAMGGELADQLRKRRGSPRSPRKPFTPVQITQLNSLIQGADHLALVAFLKKHPAPSQLINSVGQALNGPQTHSPLHLAVQSERLAAVIALLEYGGDPLVLSMRSETSFDLTTNTAILDALAFALGKRLYAGKAEQVVERMTMVDVNRMSDLSLEWSDHPLEGDVTTLLEISPPEIDRFGIAERLNRIIQGLEGDFSPEQLENLTEIALYLGSEELLRAIDERSHLSQIFLRRGETPLTLTVRLYSQIATEAREKLTLLVEKGVQGKNNHPFLQTLFPELSGVAQTGLSTEHIQVLKQTEASLQQLGKTMQLLLTIAPELINSRGEGDYPPALLAASTGCFELADRLIDWANPLLLHLTQEKTPPPMERVNGWLERAPSVAWRADSSGLTPLMQIAIRVIGRAVGAKAFKTDWQPLVTCLLEHGASPLVERLGNSDSAPLRYAVEKSAKSTHLIDALIGGHQELCCGPLTVLLHNAIRAGDRRKVEKLRALGVPAKDLSGTPIPKEKVSRGNITDIEAIQGLITFKTGDAQQLLAPFVAAAWEGDLATVEAKLPLITGSLLLDGFDGITQSTALMAAALRGDLEMIRVLATAGADPSAQGRSDGFTALHAAATLGDSEAYRFLMMRATNPNPVTIHGISPTDLLSFRGGPTIARPLFVTHEGISPLHVASGFGEASALLLHLIGAGASINASLGNHTPLEQAHGQVISQLIINLGGERSQLPPPDKTPPKTSQNPHLSTVISRIAMQMTVSVELLGKVDPNAIPLGGTDSPLHLAVRMNMTPMVKAVLAVGGDPRRPNTSGESAIDMARDKDPQIMKALLTKAGYLAREERK